MSNPVALETTAFEVFRTSAQIEQLWGFAATVYVRIWRWHRQDMIDVKAGRVCTVALSEYLIKTPHTKAEMMSKVCFCFLPPLNPAWFGSSLFSSFASLCSLPFFLLLFSRPLSLRSNSISGLHAPRRLLLQLTGAMEPLLSGPDLLCVLLHSFRAK